MTEDNDDRLQKLLARQRHLMAEIGNLSRSGIRASDSRESEVKLLGEEIARLNWQKKYGLANKNVTMNIPPAESPSDTKADVSDVEWYRVIEAKVLIKKGMCVKAKTWSWVVKDQIIQVLPGRLKDDLGQEWVEITRFELWRSCLRNSGFNEGRGFALVDGSLLTKSDGTLLGLGAFLCGPLRSSAQQIPCNEELGAYRIWCDATACQSINKEQRPETLQCHTESSWERFEVTHVRLKVYERPQMDSRVLHQKMRGDIVAVELERPDGWMKLAENAGWVCLDIRKDPTSKEFILKQQREEALSGSYALVMSQNMDVAKSSTSDGRSELRRTLEASECADFRVEVLERAVNWARALRVEDEYIYKAMERIEEMHAEGEMARYVRIIRQNVANSFQMRDANELQSLKSRIERRLDESPGNENLVQLAEEARDRLDQLLVEEDQVKCQNQCMLDKLQTAFASGNAETIKAARDQAKAAGVSKKEIARAAALAQAA